MVGHIGKYIAYFEPNLNVVIFKQSQEVFYKALMREKLINLWLSSRRDIWVDPTYLFSDFLIGAGHEGIYFFNDSILDQKIGLLVCPSSNITHEGKRLDNDVEICVFEKLKQPRYNIGRN